MELPENGLGWKKVIRLVARVTGERDDTEELVHSAYLRLEEYKTKHTISNPLAFLVRTARNLATDERRKAKVRNGQSAVSATEMAALIDENPLQDEVLAARARLRQVMDGLDRVSPRTRQIFLRCRLDGLRYMDVASEYGISVSAVEKHVAKAMIMILSYDGER